ncbi:2007_t:CDS:2, partial [Racocetra fulgida]
FPTNNEGISLSSNEEISLPSNDEISLPSNNEMLPNNDAAVTPNNNETILPSNDETILSSNKDEIQYEDVDEYLHGYAWQEKFVVIKIRNERSPPPDETYSSYNDFIRDFYLCRNDLSPAGFDIRWHKIIEFYPKAANYLNSELYSSKGKWAKAYMNKFFTAGILSTSRVESENAVIKNVLQGCPSLCELALSGAFADCFPEIDRVLKEHLTIKMLSRQRHEIIQSLYYYVVTENREMPNDKHAEKSYDTQQIHLDSLLEDLPPNDIIKTYKIQRRHCVHINYVIILVDRSHLCICMLLVNSGLVCQHFWHVFAIDNDAFFHMTLIPRRWYNNEKMQDLYLDEQLYMTSVGLVSLYEGCLPCPSRFSMHQIVRIHDNDVFGSEVCRAVQKRHDYGKTFGLARKAVQSAVEKSGESLCHLKRSLHKWFAKEQRLAHVDNNNKENFNPEHVKNPIERWQKGRPSVKRLKSSTEQVRSKKPQNKCGK